MGSAERVHRRDGSAVLRLSEAEALDQVSDPDNPAADERMILNMGPAHPSTHGVLRLMLEMEGETILRTKPVKIGRAHV
mgnify:FL=1